MHSFSSLYNENTVISKEYTGPLDFDITKQFILTPGDNNFDGIKTAV